MGSQALSEDCLSICCLFILKPCLVVRNENIFHLSLFTVYFLLLLFVFLLLCPCNSNSTFCSSVALVSAVTGTGMYKSFPGFSLCWVEKLEHCKPPLTSWSCSILHWACWVEIQLLNEFPSLFAKPLCCCGSAGLCGSASHSCNLGPHLSFSKTVITDSHVNFSALMSPQFTDRVLKIIFLNRPVSKHVPRCRKKPTPNSS